MHKWHHFMQVSATCTTLTVNENLACKLFFFFFFQQQKCSLPQTKHFVTPNHVLKLWDNVLSLQSVWRFWQDDSICKLSTSLLKIFVPRLHCLICKSMPGQFTACLCSFNLSTWSPDCEWFFPCVAFSFTWQHWPWVAFVFLQVTK